MTQTSTTISFPRYKKVFLTFFLILVWAIKLFACNCEGEGTIGMSVKNSDVVFSGQVISRTLTKNYDSLGVTVKGNTSKISFKWREFPTSVVKIKVDKMYKGFLVSDTLTILTPPNGASCGYYFQVGQKYIVYATTFDQMLMTHKLKRRAFDNKTFWTHQCTRTSKWTITEEKEILKVKI
ncbi:hypothetical protein [Pedobacter sp. SL55]|uniref:hypothetical protein n=1 Tax=Pedobacter sp. SL55 TaxID=2995161 RepID=UPI00226FBACF|nr:hypothetical protein [Pedobacter sp. SL55]WAC41054.1 hypothetical protein OVA16_01365 [Pedobacter sp. SL55]